MKKLLILTMAATFSLVVNAGFLGSKNIAVNTDAPNKDYDTVNGSIKVGHKSHVGDLSTVNGSVKVASDSKIGAASTVNGSVVFEDNVSALSAETVNGSITLGANCQIENNVETVNGSITSKQGCVIGGDFETVNGKLKAVGTRIEGNVLAVNGRITLLDGTIIENDIIIKKNKGFFSKSNKKMPIVILGKDVVVDGDLKFEKAVKLYIHDSVDMDLDIENAETSTFSGDDLPY